jgi:hypothetical protein
MDKFTKADLRDGMIVKCRNGNEYVVNTKTGMWKNRDGIGTYITPDRILDNLKNSSDAKWDIAEVYARVWACPKQITVAQLAVFYTQHTGKDVEVV